MFKLNVRYIVKLLGMTHLLESFFMLAATGVAFGYDGCSFRQGSCPAPDFFCT